MARAINFFEFKNFDVGFGISVPRHKNGWCSHRIDEKVVITTRPTVQLSYALF